MEPYTIESVMTIIGLSLTLAGTVWLIFDGQRFFSLLQTVHKEYDRIFRQFGGTTTMYITVGLDQHVRSAVRAGRRASIVGILLIAIGTICQIIGALSNVQPPH